MPSYTFKNINTDEQWTEILSMSDRDRFLKDNPHIHQLIVKAPSIGDPVRLGRVHHDGGFNDVLKKIKSHHRGSTIQPR